MTFSIPITATKVSGIVLDSRPLPSFSTTISVPVSAIAKLTPVTPKSAARKIARKRVRERVIEIDLLGRHRLALDDILRALGLCQCDDVVARIGRVGGEEHLAAARFELGGQLDQQFVEMRDRVGFDSMRRVALVLIRRELGFDLREVIEMARAGALELAPQLMVGDGGAARLEEIAGFRQLSHLEMSGLRLSAVSL